MRVWPSLFLASAHGGPIPDDRVQDLTIYHVNPINEGVMPFNMDSGDAPGDMMFDFRSKVLPYECRDNPTAHDCTNPEVVGALLVITKVVLEVDKNFGHYARCNLCVDGSDGHGDDSCTDGTYVCSCSADEHVHEDCPKAVGWEDILDTHSGECKDGDSDWQCWHDHVPAKTQGAWISTVKDGYCGDGEGDAAPDCTWRIKPGYTPKVISKACSDEHIYDVIENYDDTAKGCFSSCSDSQPGPDRNENSLCWVKCFFDTFLGPEGGVYGGQIGGIPMDDVTAAWELAFDECPDARRPPVANPFNLYSRSSYTCLDLLGGDTTNGQHVGLWTCNGASSQKWIFTDDYQIQLADDTSKCLDIPGAGYYNGNMLWIWDCNYGEGQQFGFDSDTWSIYAKNSESITGAATCIDVPDTNDGTLVWIWECNGMIHQNWYVPPSYGTRNINTHLDGNMCLDLLGQEAVNGAPVQLWECNGQPSQQWWFVDWNIFYSGSNMCLDIPGEDYSNGNFLQLWECLGSDGQRWGWDQDSGGIYSDGSGASKCLDIPGWQAYNGNGVWIWDCSGDDAQGWYVPDYGVLAPNSSVPL